MSESVRVRKEVVRRLIARPVRRRVKRARLCVCVGVYVCV